MGAVYLEAVSMAHGCRTWRPNDWKTKVKSAAVGLIIGAKPNE